MFLDVFHLFWYTGVIFAVCSDCFEKCELLESVRIFLLYPGISVAKSQQFHVSNYYTCLDFPPFPLLFLSFVFYLCWNVVPEMLFTLAFLPKIQLKGGSILWSKAFIGARCLVGDPEQVWLSDKKKRNPTPSLCEQKLGSVSLVKSQNILLYFECGSSQILLQPSKLASLIPRYDKIRIWIVHNESCWAAPS